MIYVFNNVRMKDYTWTELDRQIADTPATYRTDFANGQPQSRRAGKLARVPG